MDFKDYEAQIARRDERIATLENTVKVSRDRNLAQMNELMNLRSTRQSNADRYAALPDDVQALQEEVAAWKDEYSKQRSIISHHASDMARGNAIVERMDGKLAKARAQVRKQRKLRKFAERGWRRDVALAEQQYVRLTEAQNRAKALEDELCMESKDHDVIIGATARAYELWITRGLDNPLPSHVNAFLNDAESRRVIEHMRFPDRAAQKAASLVGLSDEDRRLLGL